MNKLGQWISNKTAKPFYARKEFRITKEIKTATAYVCGLGQFHFYMNGKKVENHELDPGWTNYDKLVQYVTFDVKEYLTEGRNAAGVDVGNGWYIMDRERYFMSMPPQSPAFSFMPPNPNPYKPYGPYLVLGFKMLIEYIDGSCEEIVSDETWKVAPHYITLANVYGSEILDGRFRQDGFAQVGFDDSAWEQAVILEGDDCPKGELTEQYQPPVTVKHTYEGKYLGDVNGRMIFDFSQNMSGLLEFEVKGKKGDVINFYPAEKLGADGDVDQIAKGWTPIDVCITYIIGEDDVWEKCRMKFSYFAGRFVAVEGAVIADAKKETNQCAEANLPILRDLKAHYLTSASEDTGSFTCDDKRLEQIYYLVKKAVECNLMSVHTDCPSIERYAWQETNHLMGPAIMYMKDVSVLWDKILNDVRVDQLKEDDWFYGPSGEKVYPGAGLVPSQAPYFEVNSVVSTPGLGNFFDIIPWGSTSILAPYWHYKFYGDKKIIEDNYETGVKYLNYLKTKVTEDGFINHGLGDWGSPDKSALCRENVETVFLYADAKVLSYFAEILGKEDDKFEWECFADCVKDNYNEKLLVKHPTEDFWCYRAWDHEGVFMSQACEAMPLYWGMVPEDKIEDVKKAFTYVMKRDNTFKSGEVGLPYIIQTMADCGLNDLITEYILREEHPSYYAFVLAGETTLGEYWENNPRSHNHDMMGHIVEWYYNGIAGIKPLKPGFEEVLIKPYLPKTATSFECKYKSLKGMVEVCVTEGESGIIAEVVVPEGMAVSVDDSILKQRNENVEWTFS